MEFNAPHFGPYIRVIAIISLLLGLSDAARLLGVNMGDISPIETLGLSGFVYLAIFCLARLFAAVGLWIKSSWGAVLLLGSTVVELALYLLGSPDVRLSAVGFVIRLILLGSILVIFALGVRLRRAQTGD